MRKAAVCGFIVALVVGSADVRAGTLPTVRIDSASGLRDALLFAPGPASSPRPLVVLLHGNGGTAAMLMGEGDERAPFRQWLALADRAKWLVAVPDGTVSAGPKGTRGWNDCRGDAATNPTVDDVAFIEQLIAGIDAQYAVDRSRVFIAGHSNGGNMALRMAIERPQVVRAVAAVAASMPAKSECAPPARFVPVLLINGTADSVMPYRGGAVGFGLQRNRGTVLSTPASVRKWASLGGLRRIPNNSSMPDLDGDDGSTVTQMTYSDRKGNVGVKLYRVNGGNHGIPSRLPRGAQRALPGMGRTNGDIESAAEIMAFFEQVSR
jgi:polyhydroxybutyrate depolymerase